MTIGRDGELAAGQQLVSPAIYLDHWALRAVSEDSSLSERLTNILSARGGTFLLSWANIAEFAGLNEETTAKAEQFIEGQLPSLFFLEHNPFDVIRREEALMAGGALMPPHADLDLLKLVIGLRPAAVQPSTCVGMLAAVGSEAESRERMKAVFIEWVAQFRAEYLDDSQFRALVDSAHRLQGVPRGTAVVLREVVAGLMRDRSAPITQNDALDFFHTIVPVAYADFVLLDGRWRDQVDRLHTRLQRMGVELPLASVFSGEDAVGRLIAALEAWSS